MSSVMIKHMLNQQTRKGAGFTIVELLIVIVVIGILAAITIVAYNGIQVRSNNTARIANANAAIKSISAYIAANGSYPWTGVNCIGTGFVENKCWGIDSVTPSSVNNTFNNRLLEISSLPNNTTPPVQTASYKALGPVYLYNAAFTVDGVSNPVFVIYFLEGNAQHCAVGKSVRPTASNTYVSTTSTPGYGFTDATSTTCYAAIPAI